MTTTFEYGVANLTDIQVVKTMDDETGKMKLDRLELDGRRLQPTKRFWTSLFSRYGISGSIFKYYDHAEVFERLTQHESGEIRTCIEKNGDVGEESLLAISSPEKPIMEYEELIGLVNKYQAYKFTYHDGVVESVHAPSVGGSNSISVLGDAFQHRYTMAAPIDGYGLPNLYLGLMREVCSNGMVALSKVFKSGLKFGKNDSSVAYIVERALEGFNNEEGFAALRSRVEASGQAWASVRETERLFEILVKLHTGKIAEVEQLSNTPFSTGMMPKLYADTTVRETAAQETASPILNALHALTGDPTRLYGVTHVQSISDRKQQALPVKCTVYDLINFATEVSTHHAGTQGARLLNGYVGELVSGDFDLEGSRKKMPNFADFHIDSKAQAM